MNRNFRRSRSSSRRRAPWAPLAAGLILTPTFAGTLFSGGSLQAQVTSGNISGVITDPTGAIVPGATVLATAPTIGVHRAAKADSNGTFTLPNLPAGEYVLTVTAPGFQSLNKTGVILAAAQNLNAGSFQLQIGTEATVVNVTADTAQLQIQADSGERSDLVTGKQLNDIALNGRNVLDLLRVVPGISGAGAFGASSTGGLDTYSVNGTRTNQHDFVVDGSSNVDSGNNGGTQVTENTDAIAEVQVLTSNFQAAFGKAGGGSIVVTTRGGTNDIHGNLHFFHRNEGLNANDWLSDHNGTPKQLFRYNTAGAQIGGPIRKDKLFYFVSTEFYRQLVPGAVIQYRVPTALERAGNFTQSFDSNGNAIRIYDPVTHAPIVGNIINPATLPAAQAANFAAIQKVLNLYPLPNTTASNGTYNRRDNTSALHPRAEYIGRVDYQITPGERLFTRYIYNQDTESGPVGNFGIQCLGNLEIPGGCVDRQPGWNVAVDLTSTLRSNLLNEVTVAPSVYSSRVTGVNGNLTAASNGVSLPLLFPVSADTSIPDLGFSGNGQSYPYTYLGSTPWHQAATNITVNDNLTWSVHAHTLKFGAFYERSRKDQIAYGNSNGQFSFDACATSAEGCVVGVANSHDGSPFASALLGQFQNFDQSSARPTGYFRYNQVEFYAQDTWQVSPRLTLDYGVRFVYIPPQYDAHHQIALFTPSAYNPATAVQVNTGGNVIPNTGNPLDGMTYSADGTLPQGGWNSQGIMPEPRLGFAYDIFGDHKGVLRGGFGTSHDREQGNLIFNTVFGNPALVQTPTIYNSNIDAISARGEAAAGVLNGIYGADRSGQVPVTYSYSLGVQRDIFAGTTLDVAYVGDFGRHLVTARDLNTIPYGTTFTRAAQNPANFAGGVVPLVEPNLPPEYAAAGYSFSGKYAYPQNYLDPYKGFGQMEYYKFDGTSNYNSLQVSVQRRYANKLTYGGFYTWSKALTTSTADESFVDPFNPRKYSYGVAGYDRTHVAAINYVYTLPAFASALHAPHWIGYATDGFQLSGLASIQSGNPVRNAEFAPANQLTGGSQYSKTPPYFVGVDHLGNLLLPTIGQPNLGAPGSLRNPGFVTWDQSIFKNFALPGEGRYIQLRGEFFNVLNHPNFSARDYGANVTLPSYNGNGTYTPLSVSKDSNWGQPTGTISPLSPGGPRVIQLAAKVYF